MASINHAILRPGMKTRFVEKAGFSGPMVKLPPFFHKLYRFFLHALL
jgi:hypothetical protein